ncbi:uncharacterized protein HD556DRAFT_1267601 [Suillus plorans]|uniref:CxC1-like cysteine cluster associated with KDZ transposases domain-containing protein n=1 Tax=Suillus plorans TaxID=116603 RepID=A0A9P7DKW1_9AGAM|nr:uncharacterized protein HD556DRAFT_1267601 [Suillus plorans]KAG1797356.1 hypothetical protein HD556DRAFT_1267601 [Suillus plorans]
MSLEERRALEALKEDTNTIEDCQEDFEDMSFGDIWNGTESLAISHAGGEFTDLAREVLGDFWKISNNRVQRVDKRTRRDRVLRRNNAFAEQMVVMTDAYLVWSLTKCEDAFRGFFERLEKEGLGSDSNCGQWSISVIDVFYAEKVSLRILSTDATISSALVRQGVMPCSPISPTVGITTEALDLYRVAHLRSPQLSIQAFVKTVCDLHGVAFHRHLSRQFSIAFDLYLQVRRSVAAMVAESLQRDSPDFRLKHACPACTYILMDEPKLTFSLLYAMDGNDSLKRVIRRSLDTDDSLGASSELPTGQQLTSNRYLSRTYVDQFARDSATADDEVIHAENLCEGRWKNMDDTKTKKAWGIYDETGIFVAVCRHGFTLLVADMIQSGELAKYPLAVVSKLLEVFGSNLGGGYDIGCQFRTTLDNSSIGPLARSLHHTCLVGAFHGHAHRRLCQLFSLTTYIKGLGLEDLEVCERTFSKSNSLASALRYASIFHRQQAIDTYFEHNDDFEVYANLSDFLYNNYRQALDILNDGSTTLPNLMRDLKVADETVFERWLEEEKVYLQGLTQEPADETLQMEYWKTLANLAASKEALDAAMTAFQDSSHLEGASYDGQVKNTRKAESARRHALEDYDRHLKLAQVLECKLEVEKRWVAEDAQWQKVGRLVANRKYQRALDRLEGLIVARIFELTKMNRAGTGYKLRKHIAKALQARSIAIRSALTTYNSIASSMYPARKTLKWEEVVEYAFLADFDLLRDTRADISQRPWASAAARRAMDLYFKMCRAREEIQHLNVEVRRLVTYIQDEDKYLRACEDQLKSVSPTLANQIAIHRNVRGRFNSRHLKRLYDISNLPGFSGTIAPGMSTNTGLGESSSTPNAQVPSQLLAGHPPFNDRRSAVVPDTPDDLDEEEQEEEVEEEASRSLQDVLRVADDFSRLELHDHADEE